MSKPFSLTHVLYDSNDPLGPIWALLSLAPPLCIASLTLHTLVTRDLRGAFVLSGLMATSCLCTLLKHILCQPRPSSSHHHNHDADSTIPDEYGMPSNHASFVSFCAVFCLYFAATQYNNKHPTKTKTKSCSVGLRWIKRWVPAIGATVIAVGCSYSRVHLGYHTASQIIVGALVGALMGVWYGYLYGGAYRDRIAPWVEQSWLGRDWDIRSYHDDLEDDEDVASFMARCLDEFRREKGKRLESEAKKKTT